MRRTWWTQQAGKTSSAPTLTSSPRPSAPWLHSSPLPWARHASGSNSHRPASCCALLALCVLGSLQLCVCVCWGQFNWLCYGGAWRHYRCDPVWWRHAGHLVKLWEIILRIRGKCGGIVSQTLCEIILPSWPSVEERFSRPDRVWRISLQNL